MVLSLCTTLMTRSKPSKSLLQVRVMTRNREPTGRSNLGWAVSRMLIRDVDTEGPEAVGSQSHFQYERQKERGYYGAMRIETADGPPDVAVGRAATCRLWPSTEGIRK